MSEPVAKRSGAAATKDAFALILTAYISQVLTLGLALLLRRQLGPAGMGYVVVAQLVTTYASFASLGAMQAAEREIPIAIARGDEQGARSLEFAGTTVAFAVSAIACTALFTMGVIRSSTDLMFGEALVSASIILFCLQVGIWATVRLRTRLRFTALGWSSAAGAIAVSSLSVVGAFAYGAPGALAGIAIGAVFQAALLFKVARIGRLTMPPRNSFRHLAALSPAFFASGATMTLLLSVDQLAVGITLGTASLGLYSAAYLGNTFVLRVPTLIAVVVYPRLQRELGATSDARRVFAMATRTTGALVIAIPVLVATFFVTLPALVFLALPDYREAISPMRMLVVGVAGLALSMPASDYLVTINRQWRQVAITGSLLAIMGFAYFVAGASGRMSLQVAAGVDAAGYFGFAIIVQVAAYRIAGQSTRQLLPLIPVFFGSTMELLLGGALADSWIPRLDPAGVLLHAGVQAALFAVTWSVLAWLYLRAHHQTRGDVFMVIELIERAARRVWAGVRRTSHKAPSQ